MQNNGQSYQRHLIRKYNRCHGFDLEYSLPVFRGEAFKARLDHRGAEAGGRAVTRKGLSPPLSAPRLNGWNSSPLRQASQSVPSAMEPGDWNQEPKHTPPPKPADVGCSAPAMRKWLRHRGQDHPSGRQYTTTRCECDKRCLEPYKQNGDMPMEVKSSLNKWKNKSLSSIRRFSMKYMPILQKLMYKI